MQVTSCKSEISVASNESFVIETAPEEDIIEENLASRLVADLDCLTRLWIYLIFKFPTLDLLKEYSTGGITINQEELEENKNRIVDTLRNYKIEIAQIKATVGPSVYII
jgi:S-DNA-T family DNA segregation ATPase FtsK/SpoIIIE